MRSSRTDPLDTMVAMATAVVAETVETVGIVLTVETVVIEEIITEAETATAALEIHLMVIMAPTVPPEALLQVPILANQWRIIRLLMRSICKTTLALTPMQRTAVTPSMMMPPFQTV